MEQETYDDDDHEAFDDDEGELCGYVCLICAHDQEDGDECENCGSGDLDPVFF